MQTLCAIGQGMTPFPEDLVKHMVNYWKQSCDFLTTENKVALLSCFSTTAVVTDAAWFLQVLLSSAAAARTSNRGQLWFLTTDHLKNLAFSDQKAFDASDSRQLKESSTCASMFNTQTSWPFPFWVKRIPCRWFVDMSHITFSNI